MKFLGASKFRSHYAGGAAFVGICIAIGVIGCGGNSSSIEIQNPYAGHYEGTLIGNSNAVFAVDVNAKGKVTGLLDDGQQKTMSGTITPVGDAEWTANPPSPEAEVTYFIDGSCDSNGCSGTWLGTTGLSGTWVCNKN